MLTPNQPTHLTFAARQLWPDLGTRTGTLLVDGAHVAVRFGDVVVWLAREMVICG